MWRVWMLAVPVLVMGCGNAKGTSPAPGDGGEAAVSEGVVIYEGRYFVLPDPETAPAPECASAAPALADAALVSIELDLVISCEGTEPAGLGWSLGTMTVAHGEDSLSLTPLVMASRDGLSGVTAADWAEYHGSTPVDPALEGALAGLALGLEQEGWSLTAAGDADAACPVAAVTGTTVVEGQTCSVGGSLLLVPVVAEEHVGPLTLEPVDDDE